VLGDPTDGLVGRVIPQNNLMGHRNMRVGDFSVGLQLFMVENGETIVERDRLVFKRDDD
jgi:hypothetical protein